TMAIVANRDMSLNPCIYPGRPGPDACQRQAVICPSSAKTYNILFATTGVCDNGDLNSVEPSSDPSVGEYSAMIPSLLTAIRRPPARIGPLQRIGSFFFFSVSIRKRESC